MIEQGTMKELFHFPLDAVMVQSYWLLWNPVPLEMASKVWIVSRVPKKKSCMFLREPGGGGEVGAYRVSRTVMVTFPFCR